MIMKEPSRRKELEKLHPEFMHIVRIRKRGDDVEVNPLQDLINCKASMDYIEACYARGDKLGSMQWQALHQVQLAKLKKIADLID